MLEKLSLFRNRLTLVVGTFAGLSLILAGMAYWVGRESHYHLERGRLAHEVHEEYLKLSLETYRLSKQLVDVLISEDQDVLANARAIEQSIHQHLDKLRAAHASEIALAEEEHEATEKGELVFLGRIEANVRKLLAALERASVMRASGQLNEAERRLIHARQDSIEVEFSSQVQWALGREVDQIKEAEGQADVLIQRYSRITEAVSITILLLAGAFIYVSHVRLRKPLDSVAKATRRLARGDLTYRVSVTGNDEFATIGRQFNAMAEQLLAQRQELEANKSGLEQSVLEKTKDLGLANEKLSRVDQNRRRFFADISHELRTPLTLIKGESQIALRGEDKSIEAYKEALQRIGEQSEHLSLMVDDLLFIARTSDGAVHIKMEVVALDKLLDRVCADARVLARDRNIQVQFDNYMSGAKVTGDKEKLSQLFMVLLTNSLRYSEPGEEVTVTLHEGIESAIVKVIDKGMGIPKADHENIFERFYRGDNVKDASIAGSGLGLPVARAIVLAHQGSIEVESEVGEGTTMIVLLPAVRKLHAIA